MKNIMSTSVNGENMIKKIVIILVFCTIYYANSAQTKNIAQKYGLNDNKVKLVAYIAPNNCIKCKLAIDYMIESILSEFDNRVEVIGFIYVDREREVNYYKKTLKWNLPLYKYDEDFKKYFKIKEADDFAVISTDNKVIYQNFLSDVKNLQADCNSLKKKIKKILEKNKKK